MSEEGGFGLEAAEKFLGLIIFIVGILALYYTVTSPDALQSFTGLFDFLSVILIILGFILLIVKVE